MQLLNGQASLLDKQRRILVIGRAAARTTCTSRVKWKRRCLSRRAAALRVVSFVMARCHSAQEDDEGAGRTASLRHRPVIPGWKAGAARMHAVYNCSDTTAATMGKL